MSSTVCSSEWCLLKYRFCYLEGMPWMFTLLLRMVSLLFRDSRLERASNAIYYCDYKKDEDEYRKGMIDERER